MPEHDPLNVTSLDETREQRELKDQLELESEQSDLNWLMSSKRGRRIVWRQLDRAGVFRLSFNTNAMTMAFSEGTRNEGLRLVSLIHSVCPELYPTMIKEAKQNDNPSDTDQHRKFN